MVKFKTTNKGWISQEFANPNIIYKDRGGAHNGIDSVLGWDKVVTCDNDCYVYKIVTSDQNVENWQGVYMLAKENDTDYVEIVQGHFNKILVTEGQELLEYTAIGLEGNKGFVFTGGGQITPAMQKAGDKRGAHTHTSYRPVKRVKRPNSKKFYLLNVKGQKYRDEEGYYYEIVHENDGTKGCVNPRNYQYKNSIIEDIAMVTKLLVNLRKRYDNK